MYTLRNFFLLLLILSLFSCKKETTPIVPFEEEQVLPKEEQLRKIDVIQTDYDSLLVQNSHDLLLQSRSILKIQLFQFDGANYVLADTSILAYTGSYGSYHPNFQFRIYVQDTVLFYKFKLKYVLYDSSTSEIDTSTIICKYPYNTAEIYYKFSDLPMPQSIRNRFAEDIDFEDGKFYYRNSGGYGIYEIDETSGAFKTLVNYVSHNYIAVESGYLYYTTEPNSIYKLDIASGSFTAFICFSRDPAYNDSAITGIDVEDNSVYVTTEGRYLIEFDTSGNFRKSFPYSELTYFLTKYGDRLYSVDIFHSKIKVYNLLTEEFENALPAPSKDIFAIRIKNGYFYFSEFIKKYIGRIPLEDIIM